MYDINGKTEVPLNILEEIMLARIKMKIEELWEE